MKVVAYYRVSTNGQRASGLGLEAQRESVAAYARDNRARLLESFTEVESGKRNDRPELAKALCLAKLTGSTLVIAKLDRLSRNAAFLLTLRDSGVRFVCADMPHADNLTIGVLALVAQQEREAISKRTREALAAAKRRGQRLGNPNGAAPLRRAGKGTQAANEARKRRAQEHALAVAPVLEEIRSGSGSHSLRSIGSALAATLSNTTHIGRATVCNRAFVEALANEALGPGEIEGHLEVQRTLLELQQVEGWDRRNLATFNRLPGWEQSLIPSNEEYGVAYLPKRSFSALLPAEVEVPEKIRFTHSAFRVLATKQKLMADLGFELALVRDERLIGNSLAYNQEASR